MSRTSSSRTTRAFGADKHGQAVERSLRPPLLHDPEQRVGNEHEAEQRVLGLAEHEDQHEHRAENRVEPRQHVRAGDLDEGPARALVGAVDEPLPFAIGDIRPPRDRSGPCGELPREPRASSPCRPRCSTVHGPGLAPEAYMTAGSFGPHMTTCFHHHDRETGRACTRCGRPACPDCLIQASVGSQCFECVKRGAPKQTVRIRQTLQRDPADRDQGHRRDHDRRLPAHLAARGLVRREPGTPRPISRSSVPTVNNGEWWRLFSYSLVHFGLLHIGSNMLMLWLVGRVLEPVTGPIRFATIYVVSVLGGAAGALIATPHGFTGGASGGVFGVAAAAALVLHRQGIRFWDAGFGPLLLINLALGLFVSNISLGGHIGGLVAGALTAEGMLQARKLETAAARLRRRGRGRPRVSRALLRRRAVARSLLARRAPTRPSRGPLASTSSPATSVMRPRGR